VLPKQLTSRARHLLEHGRDLLERLRRLSDELPSVTRQHTSSSAGTSLVDSLDPFGSYYGETTAMVEVALRLIQGFPATPTAQLRMCDGVEAIFLSVAERIAK